MKWLTAQLETASLNHTAAHHRISVRPKNRRPPKRNAVQNGIIITSNIPPTINESSDTLDSLELISSGVSSSNASSPVESKNVSILRKSSSRLSRNSDIFEELEAKLPRKQSSVISLSPDSLDSTPSRTFNDTIGVDSEDHSPENRSITRRYFFSFSQKKTSFTFSTLLFLHLLYFYFFKWRGTWF